MATTLNAVNSQRSFLVIVVVLYSGRTIVCDCKRRRHRYDQLCAMKLVPG